MILKALSRSRDDRFPDVASFAAAFVAAAGASSAERTSSIREAGLPGSTLPRPTAEGGTNSSAR